MKKLLVLSVFLLVVGFVNASLNSVDLACQNEGFNYGVEKFEWNGESYILGEDNLYYDIVIEDNNLEADWTATPAVTGVIVKGELTNRVSDGGTSGTVYSADANYGISYVIFCSNTNEVPEFGVIAGIVALIAGIGIIAYRRM